MRVRALMRKWCWQLGQTFIASSTTLRKSMSPQSGQRSQRPSGMPSFSFFAGSDGICDIVPEMVVADHRGCNSPSNPSNSTQPRRHEEHEEKPVKSVHLSRATCAPRGGDPIMHTAGCYHDFFVSFAYWW